MSTADGARTDITPFRTKIVLMIHVCAGAAKQMSLMVVLMSNMKVGGPASMA